MSSNLKVNNILPSTGDTVAVSGIASVTSSVSIASSCTATTFYGSGANLTNLPAQATIANNADNRIITGGSGVNLNGEANLIFNGTELYPASGIGTNVGHRLNYRRNAPQSRTNTGNAAQQYYKIGEIILNGSESAEINIYGTNGYSNGSEVAGKTTIILRATNGNTLAGFWYEETLGNANLSDVRWKFSSGQTYELWVKAAAYSNIAPFIRCTGNGFTSFNYATGDGSAPSGSSQLSSYHRKNVGTINTIRYNSTDTTFHRNIKMDSGYGIDFSARSGSNAGATSSILDDYEEGVYQPTMTGSTSGSHTFVTYTHIGYTRIGRLVHIQGYININGGSLSGNLKLSLPFVVSNDAAGHSRYSAIGLSWRGHGWSANTGEITFAPQPNTTYGEFVSVSPNGNHIWVNNTHVNNSYNIRIGGCYITNT